MSYLTQKTLKNKINFGGIALHSGHNVNVCIKPAKPDFGIVFKRVDLKINNIKHPLNVLLLKLLLQTRSLLLCLKMYLSHY